MRLQGVDGIPQEPSRVDSLALTYLFINGRKLSEVNNKLLNSDFFIQLEALVMKMHEHGVAHLDLRRGSNILYRDNGSPAIIDFQSSIIMDKLPPRIRHLLQSIDLSGVYKNWLRFAPSSLDSERKKLLSAINRVRRFWVLKGYPFG
jgi:predicted Ser/Thr protein kinase